MGGKLRQNTINGVRLLDLQGPVFLHEPPHRVEFSNNSLTTIECSGSGSPAPEVSFKSLRTTPYVFMRPPKSPSLESHPQILPPFMIFPPEHKQCGC
ncbi:Immunoglobulin-like domain [Sergentomyia squamirostris]